MAQHRSHVFCHLSFFCTGESPLLHPLLVHCFLCFFLHTGDGEWCQEEFGASGVLCTETDVLSEELEQLGSEMVESGFHKDSLQSYILVCPSLKP